MSRVKLPEQSDLGKGCFTLGNLPQYLLYSERINQLDNKNVETISSVKSTVSKGKLESFNYILNSFALLNETYKSFTSQRLLPDFLEASCVQNSTAQSRSSLSLSSFCHSMCHPFWGQSLALCLGQGISIPSRMWQCSWKIWLQTCHKGSSLLRLPIFLSGNPPFLTYS